ARLPRTKVGAVGSAATASALCAASVGLAEQVAQDIGRETARLEESPRARATRTTRPLERALGPRPLRLPVERRLDGRRDQPVRQAARAQVGSDLEAARAARAQRPCPLPCHAPVAPL